MIHFVVEVRLQVGEVSASEDRVGDHHLTDRPVPTDGAVTTGTDAERVGPESARADRAGRCVFDTVEPCLGASRIEQSDSDVSFRGFPQARNVRARTARYLQVEGCDFQRFQKHRS